MIPYDLATLVVVLIAGFFLSISAVIALMTERISRRRRH